MRDNIWKNADGLEVGFGRRNTVNLSAGGIETRGQLRQVEMEIFCNKSVVEASVKNAVLPVGAVITAATLYVKEAFTGGVAVTVGTIGIDGLGLEAESFITQAEAPVSALVAGAVIKGEGDLVGMSVDTPLNIVYSNEGTMDSGHATLLVEYIHPSAAK